MLTQYLIAATLRQIWRDKSLIGSTGQPAPAGSALSLPGRNF